MGKGVFGVGFDPYAVKQLVEKPVHKKSKLSDLKHIPMAFAKWKRQALFKGEPTWFVRIMGAAGEEEDIPQPKLKIMSDIYDKNTRDFFTDILLTDPIISPATDRRMDSIFEDGFHFELVDAQGKPQVETSNNDNMFQSAENIDYDAIIKKLETWKDDVNLLGNMRDAAGVSFAQGRACSLISPPLLDLQTGQLPRDIEIINEEDLGEPIVDIGLTKQIVGLGTELDGKQLLRPDEMIYITRGKRGLRKEGKFYGSSPLEPILQLSKAIKRIYNYDIPEAIIAAYITKTLFTINDQGDPTTQKARIDEFITNYLTTGKLAFAMSDEVMKVDTIQPKVDTQMIDVLESKLADIILSVVGVPKSMMNREHGLTRDIATIEAIQFVRFVRKPDEQLLAEAYENQLINRLMAHLAGKPLGELSKRIKIVRNDSEQDLGELFSEPLAATKDEETSGVNPSMAQPDAVSTFGAGGGYTIISPSGGEYIVRNNPNNQSN